MHVLILLCFVVFVHRIEDRWGTRAGYLGLDWTSVQGPDSYARIDCIYRVRRRGLERRSRPMDPQHYGLHTVCLLYLQYKYCIFFTLLLQCTGVMPAKTTTCWRCPTVPPGKNERLLACWGFSGFSM